MASIRIEQDGRNHTFGNLSINHAENTFDRDKKKAKENKDLTELKEYTKDNEKVFFAKFFDGWNYWQFTECLNYEDNNTYCR